MIDIRCFTGEFCPSEVYKFRYSVYVEEMGRKQRFAHHDEKIIVDPLDASGVNIVAFENEEIVGCVRINLIRDRSIGDYAEFYGINTADAELTERASICTRLMMRRSKRRTAATINVMLGVYEYALRNGVQTNYIDCNRHLVEFFAKFGYVKLGVKAHPEYGEVTIMRLDLHDGDRLAAIGSPFAPLLEKILTEKAEARTKVALECF